MLHDPMCAWLYYTCVCVFCLLHVSQHIYLRWKWAWSICINVGWDSERAHLDTRFLHNLGKLGAPLHPYPPHRLTGQTGSLESVDWTTGLEYWNGLNCYKKPFFWHDSFLESGYSLSHFTNFLHALFSHPGLPWSLGGQRSRANLVSLN